MTYPFNHECQWQGPFYFFTSNHTDEKPPADCRPAYSCSVCGALRVAEPRGDNDAP